MSHNLRIKTIFLLHAVWYEDRALQILKISMSQAVKKGPCRVDYWALENFIFTYFQTLMWFYLFATKDHLLGKPWGKTLLRCEMPWTNLTQTGRSTSRLKWKYWKRSSKAEILFKSWSRVYCIFKEPPRRKERVCTKDKIKKFSLKAIQYDIIRFVSNTE